MKGNSGGSIERERGNTTNISIINYQVSIINYISIERENTTNIFNTFHLFTLPGQCPWPQPNQLHIMQYLSFVMEAWHQFEDSQKSSHSGYDLNKMVVNIALCCRE